MRRPARRHFHNLPILMKHMTIPLVLLVLLKFFFPCFVARADTDREGYGFRLGTRTRREVSYVPQGVGTRLDALDPSLRKWYVPQELFPEYQWRQWDTTNYAKMLYARYINPGYEGDYFYDIYGNLVTRGWLIYDWRHTQNQEFGSGILQAYKYGSWFADLLISGDSKGEYHYRLMIGDEINTVLTPLTFMKRDFNGVRWDFLSDRYETTVLLSRISMPAFGSTALAGTEMPYRQTDITSLLAGRMIAKVTGFLKIGATFVGARQSQTMLPMDRSRLFKGRLSSTQNNGYVHLIQVALSDDSPEDGAPGAWLFDEEIIIMDLEGREFGGNVLGFHPRIEGGTQHVEYVAADGKGIIRMTYDLRNPSYRGPRAEEIHHITIRLLLSGDYRVEVTSNRQASATGRLVLLPVCHARGNPRIGTRQRWVSFDYGLPTANNILGFTVELTDAGGFDVQGEVDFNRQYRQYPNTDLRKHRVARTDAWAGYINVAYRRYPFLVFGEGFHMDLDYRTSIFVDYGGIDYSDERQNVYEFVEDNDDQDSKPDWNRQIQYTGADISDPAVFPGWDENNDGISDFNQNDNPSRRNFIPDYDEPFLRFSCDRPEYLFGMDMNNNGWVDRFENDDLADYLYKKDHRGYNLYVSTHMGPGIRVLGGQLRERQLSSGRKNLSTYGVFALDRSYPWTGRIRVFEMARVAKDSIEDDLYPWNQPIGAEGVNQKVEDPLAYRNTFVNTFYADHEYVKGSNFIALSKLKYEVARQRDRVEWIHARNARRDASFFGIINKLSYQRDFGGLFLEPRWKSEFLVSYPYRRSTPGRRELRQTVSLFVRTMHSKMHKARVWRATMLDFGVEVMYFDQLRRTVPEGMEEDHFGMVGLFQLTESTDFRGYRLITQAGFRLNRQVYRDGLGKTSGTAFVTMYAGIQG